MYHFVYTLFHWMQINVVAAAAAAAADDDDDDAGDGHSRCVLFQCWRRRVFAICVKRSGTVADRRCRPRSKLPPLRSVDANLHTHSYMLTAA